MYTSNWQNAWSVLHSRVPLQMKNSPSIKGNVLVNKSETTTGLKLQIIKFHYRFNWVHVFTINSF